MQAIRRSYVTRAVHMQSAKAASAHKLPLFNSRDSTYGCRLRYTKDHDEANQMVEELREYRRLYCHTFGMEKPSAWQFRRTRKESTDAVCFADDDTGTVTFLHVSAMRQLPLELVDLLSDPHVLLESISNLPRFITNSPGPLQGVPVPRYLDIGVLAALVDPNTYYAPFTSSAVPTDARLDLICQHQLGKFHSTQVEGRYTWNAQRLSLRSPELEYASDTVWAGKLVTDSLRDSLYQTADELEGAAGYAHAREFLDECLNDATVFAEAEI